MGLESDSRFLTFLIADVRGYTSYTQAHGDEAAARLAGAFAEIAREGVEAHGGDVIELRGDEALAVFERSSEALRAAVDLQLVFADEVDLHPDVPLRVGIGVDAGAAVPVEGGYRGGALNLAARLCSKAGPGEVLASQGVMQGVGAVEGLGFHDHGAFEMKGITEPVHVARVSPADLDPDALAARFTRNGRASPTATEVPRALDTATPIVGRDRDIHRLRWAWRQARRSEGSMIPLLGPQGIGKTRLLAELAVLASHDGAKITYASLRGPLDAAILDHAFGSRAPTLVLLDDAETWPEASDSFGTLSTRVAGTNALLVIAMDDSSLAPDLRAEVAATDGTAVRPGPLDLHAIREIAGSYIGASADALPASLLESTGGVPRRIHRQVSEWALAEANRRLGLAASRAATGRSDLRSVESELAGNVVDLQQIQERARLFASVDRRTDEPEESPFKGLAFFDVGDADLFFGRERLVAELVARLAGASLLGVVGPSGSGKSSAVRAGLVPAIRSGVLPGSDEWDVALMRPGEHPMDEVARTLGRTPADLPSDRHSLLVVDQFEEVFTVCADEEEQARFLTTLAEAANDPEGRVTVVVAIRADLYGRCAEEPALAELLGTNHVLVGPMTTDEYRRAIEQPALRVGVHVESALTEALVVEVGDEPGALPLLSTALLELWEHRDGRAIRLEAYLQTGGVRGAVARLAEAVYGGFAVERQAITRAVMLRLAAPGEGDTTVRRRVPLAEFDAARDRDVADVVGALIDRRLLTVSDGVVEVAHEALLREWPRLRAWLEEDRAGRVLHAHLMDTARLWEVSDRDQGELYRGARLASAIDWTTEHTLELNEREREFLNASRDASEREADRQRRSNRRLRGLLVGVAIFLALALVAGGIALVQRGKAEEAATEATARRLGAQAVIEDELDLSLLLARQGYEIDDSLDTRSTLLASILKAPGAISVLSGTGNRVLVIRASADGRTFATTDNTGGVAIYDAERLALERIVRFPEQYWFDISPDGGTLAGSTFEQGESLIGLVNTTTGEKQRVPLPEGADFAAFGMPTAFDPNGSSFVTLECRPCDDRFRVVLVRRDPSDGSERSVTDLPMVDFGVDRIEFSGDGRTLAVIGSDDAGGKALFLDAASLDVRHELRREDLHSSALSEDGQTLAVGSQDGSVAVIDLRTGSERGLDGRHDASVQGVAFSPDGATLVSTGDDAAVNVWDLATGSLREILGGHAGRVTTAPVFDADGSTAYTVGLDGNVIAWDLDGERRIGRALPITDGAFLGGVGDGTPPTFDFVAAAPANGAIVATTNSDGHVIGVDPTTGNVRWEADPWTDAQLERMRSDDPAFADSLTGWVTEMAFDPNGDVLAVAGENPEVVLYDASTGRELARWRASRHGWVNGVSVAPDGSVVTSNDDGRVVLWEPASGRVLHEFRFVDEVEDLDSWTGAPFRAVVSPDGTRLAVTVANRRKRWDVTTLEIATGERQWTRPGDEDVTIPAWSPDSRTLALGGWQNGALTLRAAATGRRLFEPVTANTGFVLSVAFTPDGSTIVTGGTDGTVRLWDSATMKQIGSNLPHDENLGTSAWVVKDDQIEVVSSRGKLYRWDLDPRRWADQACLVANRTLTRSEWRSFLPDLPYDPACAP
jgi:WD40 repeat protein/class 3 adenylate cyclase/energy-coupling factor transporter ATP-binding protein EcfA2